MNIRFREIFEFLRFDFTRFDCNLILIFKEWVFFFLGSWGMNRSAGQTNLVSRVQMLSAFYKSIIDVCNTSCYQLSETYAAFLAEIKASNTRVFSLNLERPHFLKVQFLYENPASDRESHMIVMLHRECRSFSMVQQRWQKSLNIVGKYHRPKGNLGVVFKKIRVKWPKFSFKNTNVSLLNAM